FTPQTLRIQSGQEQGDRQLVLAGLLENVTGETQVSVFGFPEKLPVLTSGDTEFLAPRITLVRDQSFLRQLEPRIREAVTIVWDLPPDWHTQEVSIAFSAQQFKLKDNLYAKAS